MQKNLGMRSAMGRVTAAAVVGMVALGLAACASETEVSGPPEMQGWRGLSGKAPTRAEYAAMVAACQDGAVRRAQAKPLEACLVDLGLRRTE
jgi:hypothetical protein